MNGCFDNQLPAVVFDGVKTSRMPSCEAVTIGRDVRGVASLAWGGVRGMGGDWSVHMVCSFVVLESYLSDRLSDWSDRQSDVAWVGPTGQSDDRTV